MKNNKNKFSKEVELKDLNLTSEELQAEKNFNRKLLEILG